jgi:hypothetical protein
MEIPIIKMAWEAKSTISAVSSPAIIKKKKTKQSSHPDQKKSGCLMKKK